MAGFDPNTANSSDNNPINGAGGDKRPHSWSFIRIQGVPSPGVIAVNGIHGFDREAGWDKKKGKGSQGATLTRTTLPPAEGKIDFLLWTPDQFFEWEGFLGLLDTGAAVDIYHPALSDLSISSVVMAKASPIYHRGKGLYMRTVEFIEWIPVPKKDITESPAKSRESKGVGLPPENENQEKLQKLLVKAGKAAPRVPLEPRH